MVPDCPDRAEAVAEYLHMTRQVLPRLAREGDRAWPIREDHCFQRIVLDAICGGVWYAHLDRPAYKHLSRDQAVRAVALCHAMADGTADVQHFNRQSLVWRGKRPK